MACGYEHSITLSIDGIVHSFGRNIEGALGLGHNNDVSLPTPIPNLPKINMVSCGFYFTVCVDFEGFLWSFGNNNYGQLGTGNTTSFNVPQKILGIPPVVSVSCGSDHALIITNDSNLWSCGVNCSGELALLDKEQRSMYQQTSFENISKIAAGNGYSLFQNNKGELYSCGSNLNGSCGLGHFNSPQITPSLIPNALNIVQFVCGCQHSLLLDSEGNVFSFGFNSSGQLGLGHSTNQNVLNKIPNIPPIKIISCALISSYLIDFEGNLWSFGSNGKGQLGHGEIVKKKYKYTEKNNVNAPRIVKRLRDIQQISYGPIGHHFLAKNSQNQIFVAGKNEYGQLGTGNTDISVSIPKEINSQYSTIWRDEFRNRAKSGRK